MSIRRINPWSLYRKANSFGEAGYANGPLKRIGFVVALICMLGACVDDTQDVKNSSSAESSSSVSSDVLEAEWPIRYRQTFFNQTGEHLRVDWDEENKQYTALIPPDGEFRFNSAALSPPGRQSQTSDLNWLLRPTDVIPEQKYALSVQFDGEYWSVGYLEAVAENVNTEAMEEFLEEFGDMFSEDVPTELREEGMLVLNELKQQAAPHQLTPYQYHHRFVIPVDSLDVAERAVQLIESPQRDLSQPLDIVVREHRQIYIGGTGQFRLADGRDGGTTEEILFSGGKSTALPLDVSAVDVLYKERLYTDISQLNSEEKLSYLKEVQVSAVDRDYRLSYYTEDQWQSLGGLGEVAEHSVATVNQGALVMENGRHYWDILHSYHLRNEVLKQSTNDENGEGLDVTGIDYNLARWNSHNLENYSYYFALDNFSPFSQEDNIAVKVTVESKVPLAAVSVFPNGVIAPDDYRITTIDEIFIHLTALKSSEEEGRTVDRKIGAAYDHKLNYPIYAYETYESRTDSNNRSYFHVITGTDDAQRISELFKLWDSEGVRHYSLDFTTTSGKEHYVEVLNGDVINVRAYDGATTRTRTPAVVGNVMTIRQLYESTQGAAAHEAETMIDFNANADGVPSSLFLLYGDEPFTFVVGKVQVRNFQSLM